MERSSQAAQRDVHLGLVFNEDVDFVLFAVDDFCMISTQTKALKMRGMRGNARPKGLSSGKVAVA
jgi:hypothetical protein